MVLRLFRSQRGQERIKEPNELIEKELSGNFRFQFREGDFTYGYFPCLSFSAWTTLGPAVEKKSAATCKPLFQFLECARLGFSFRKVRHGCGLNDGYFFFARMHREEIAKSEQIDSALGEGVVLFDDGNGIAGLAQVFQRVLRWGSHLSIYDS